MKINRKKVYALYMAWVKKVSESCEWKSTFGPEEIVDKICSIIENKNVTEKEQDIKLLSKKEIIALAKKQKYAVYHKPTKTWVYFKNHGTKTLICLCLKIDATVSYSKESLEKLILESEFNSYTNYGKENFLEFKIKKI